jgi:hypothetical protein
MARIPDYLRSASDPDRTDLDGPLMSVGSIAAYNRRWPPGVSVHDGLRDTLGT